MLPDFRLNLAICHLISGFNRNDTFAELLVIKASFQLELSISRTKYLDEFRIADAFHDVIIVTAEGIGKLITLQVTRPAIPGDIPRKTDLFLQVCL